MTKESTQNHIDNIIDAVSKAAGGDYAVRLDVPDKDAPLSELAGAVNRMIDAMRDQADSLRRSEQHHRLVVETMNEAVGLGDADGVLTYVNRRFCEYLGVKAEDVVGRRFIDLLDEDNRRRWIEQQEKRKQGIPTTYELALTRPEGEAMYCVASGAPLLNDDGRYVGSIGILTDITERRRWEEALRMFRFSVSHAPDAVFWVGREGTFEYVNEQACRSLGYTREELMALRLWDVDPLFPKDRWRDWWDGHWRDGKVGTLQHETRHRRKDGTVFPVEVSARHIWFKDREFHVAYVRDITGRKAIAEALRLTQYAIDRASIACFWKDENGRFTYVNDQACRSLGYTREALLEKNAWDIDVEFDRERFKSCIARLRKKGSVSFETTHQRSDGSTFPVEITANYVEFGGREYSCAYVSDITARKHAEATLQDSIRLLKESQRVARLGHYAFDVAAGCWESSETVDEILGIDDRYPKTVDGWLQLVHPEHRREMGAYLSEHVMKERNPFDREYRIVRPADGREIWVYSLGRLELDGEGNVRRIIGTIQDIDERKRLEEQLLQSQKMEAVGQLAGGVAHDFNNMLSVILGYAELMRLRLTPDDPMNRDLMEIEKAATRSRDITRQLLAFSRKQIIAPRVMDLNRQISDTLKGLSRLIGENIHLRFFPEKDLDTIRFDPSQIDQILVNLAVNARDAMPGGGKLTIETANVCIDEDYCRVHAQCKSGRYVLLTVSDNGAGIERADLAHIFEPFFTTKSVDKGTGLGLATVYGIVKQNGGTVNVYSEPGKGTTFRIYFPPVLKSVQAGAEKAGETAGKMPPASAKGTVLLVEDDEMVRNITSAMLKKLGLSVVVAKTPLEALSIFENADTPVDLLLSDVVMPDMSGTELRDRIKAIQPDIKVLFMSGYTSNVIVHHGVLEDGVHFVHKPFSMNDLARKVRDAIEGD